MMSCGQPTALRAMVQALILSADGRQRRICAIIWNCLARGVNSKYNSPKGRKIGRCGTYSSSSGAVSKETPV